MSVKINKKPLLNILSLYIFLNKIVTKHDPISFWFTLDCLCFIKNLIIELKC